MSESRNNSESRGSRYTSTYVSRASESRNNSESRCDSRGQVNNTRYNNLDDIDSLIEKLEREMPTITSNNPRINQALEQRRQKIEELKRLRDEARRESEEEKQLRMLEQSNDELDDIIGSVKKLVRKPSKPKIILLILVILHMIIQVKATIQEKVDGKMENIYKNLHSNQKILIYEMLKRGISVEVLDESLELIKASFNGHDELIYDRDSSIMPYNVSILAGDKGITKHILQNNGISVPMGEVFNITDSDYILKAFKVFDCPVVLKPVFGSHGYDVYTNITSEKDLLKAIDKITQNRGINTKVLIEEYFKAKEYRVFVTRNRDYAVLHRDPAHVYGDGEHSIKELIAIENYCRMNPRTNALCEILVDDEMYKYIKANGISIDTIPTLGEKVYLRPNSNVAMGGICEDYTDRVHPSVIDICMRVLDAFPGLPYVGIDFMTNSIEELQNDDSYRIIEINTVPGVHMHFRPAIGKSQNIAKYMVDMIFPETKTYEKGEENGYQKSLKRF